MNFFARYLERRLPGVGKKQDHLTINIVSRIRGQNARYDGADHLEQLNTPRLKTLFFSS